VGAAEGAGDQAVLFDQLWRIKHGMSTSMYYGDPDCNKIEFQIDNFPDIDACNACFVSPGFDGNLLRVQCDPEALSKKPIAGMAAIGLLRQGPAPLPPEREYLYVILPPLAH
jgi:hypothetical protein